MADFARGRGRGRGGGRGGRGRGRGRESAAPVFASGGKRVFVGNLSYNTSWQDLKDAMREAGEVVFADVLVDAASGRSRGCGVVEFARAEGAEIAIATPREIDGRAVFVREDREDGGGRRGGARASARVFVGNLSYDASWRDLKDAMREAGEVAFAEVLVDAASGRSRGCGVVEFARAEDAENAIATLQEAEIGGRPVFVREDRDRAGGAFAKGGRGGRGGRGRGGSRGGGRFSAPQLDSRW